MQNMKNFLTLVCAVAISSLFACAEVGAEKEVKGYPAYKFLNFSGINAKALKENETEAKEALGEAYESYVERHESFVAHGFDCHTPLQIRTESGEEVEVYIRDEDYKQLWTTSPHDLADQKKSHLVTIKYVQVEVEEESVNRAVSFQAVLVEKEPIIRK